MPAAPSLPCGLCIRKDILPAGKTLRPFRRQRAERGKETFPAAYSLPARRRAECAALFFCGYPRHTKSRVRPLRGRTRRFFFFTQRRITPRVSRSKSSLPFRARCTAVCRAPARIFYKYNRPADAARGIPRKPQKTERAEE